MRTWGIAAGFVCFLVAATFAVTGSNFAGGAQQPDTAATTKDAAAPTSAEGGKFYDTEVRPILEAHCYSCHGSAPGGDNKSGFSLLTRSAFLKGGENGPVFAAERPDESAILQAINYAGLEMPPKGKLPKSQIDIITKWVKMGAPWSEVAPIPRTGAPRVDDAARNFWSFRKYTRPEVPAVKSGEWVQTPVDAFVLAKLEENGLTPAPPTEKSTLLRRVYYDLIGLPPSVADVDAFLTDNSPTAFEKVVDRLLDSPQYGERWARHWLDLVRYAESDGYEFDRAKPDVWRYRDYVIRSFNDDKPYDAFVREQLAGDEFVPPTTDSIVATGFYKLGISDGGAPDKLQASFDGLDDIIATTGQTFLGLTMNCARCHDHKIDPFPTADYYRMLAFFRGVQGRRQGRRMLADMMLPNGQGNNQANAQGNGQRNGQANRRGNGQGNDQGNGQGNRQANAQGNDQGNSQGNVQANSQGNVQANSQGNVQANGQGNSQGNGQGNAQGVGMGNRFGNRGNRGRGRRGGRGGESRGPINQEEIAAYQKAYKELTAKLTEIEDALEPFLDEGEKGDFEVEEYRPPIVRAHVPQDITPETWDKYESVLSKRDELEKNRPASLASALTVSEGGVAPPPTYILLRGSPYAEGDRVEPGFPTVVTPESPKIPTPAADSKSSGRRTVLAEWVTNPENPLTARVIANRLWQYHFGRGIVRTSSDFGYGGAPPTHPELLNWLASELVAGDWRLKRIHKLLVMSNVYQMSSQPNEVALAKDADNDLFWRFELRRLAAEEIRDSILTVSGNLNPKMGGPSIYPLIVDEVKAGQSRPGEGWYESEPQEQARRTIYAHVKRSLTMPLMQVYDSADTDASCPVRFATTQPTQALSMLNSPFLNEQAAIFARDIRKQAGDDVTAQVTLALRRAMQRKPTDAEVARGVELIQRLQTSEELSPDAALVNYCLITMNLNEFMYLD
ncbi:MAG: DUF1553 domain-containing protein [Pirellulales bacterium]